VVDDENVVHSARDAVGLPGAAVLEREAIPVDPSQSSSEVGDDLLTVYHKNHVTRTTKEPVAPPIGRGKGKSQARDNTDLRLNMSPSRPPTSSSLPNDSAYAVATHFRSLLEKPSACWHPINSRSCGC